MLVRIANIGKSMIRLLLQKQSDLGLGCLSRSISLKRLEHFMRGSRNFRQGGPGQSDKKSSDNGCLFFSPQIILQKSNGQFQRNLSFFKVPEGVQHFPGEVQLFPGRGGVQLLIPYRNPYNL